MPCQPTLKLLSRSAGRNLVAEKCGVWVGVALLVRGVKGSPRQGGCATAAWA